MMSYTRRIPCKGDAGVKRPGGAWMEEVLLRAQRGPVQPSAAPSQHRRYLVPATSFQADHVGHLW